MAGSRSRTSVAENENATTKRRLLSAGQPLQVGSMTWSLHAVALVVLALLLTLVGLTFVASASSVSALHKTGSSWSILQKQTMWAGLGVMAMIVTALIPFRVWSKLAPVFFGFTVFCTCLTLTPLGQSRGGSSRWLGGSTIGFQPSEPLKLATILMFAVIFSKVTNPALMAERSFQLRPVLLVLGCAIGPVAMQPDMGTSVVIFLAAAAVIAAAGMPRRNLGEGGLMFGLVGLAYTFSSSYRTDRVTAFLHPNNDPTGIGYHVAQSKIGFASGRLLGVGIGASRAKWGFVPNAHTDFVFAIIGEELGLVGATVVLGLFAAVALIGLSVANHCQDRFAALVVIGLVTWIVSQAVINIGTVLGALPVTGVPMPFVSYGGSSFVVIAGAFGILVNIARTVARRVPVRDTSRSTRSARPVRPAVS